MWYMKNDIWYIRNKIVCNFKNINNIIYTIIKDIIEYNEKIWYIINQKKIYIYIISIYIYNKKKKYYTLNIIYNIYYITFNIQYI